MLFIACAWLSPACGDDGGPSGAPTQDAQVPDAQISDAAPDTMPDTMPDAQISDAASAVDAASFSYAADIEPIWLNRCFPCHIGDMANRFPRLDMGRELLVGQLSQQLTTLEMVAPGDVAGSYLWIKLNDEQGQLNTTAPMPPPNLGGTFAPLSDGELGRIRAWIASGGDDTW